MLIANFTVKPQESRQLADASCNWSSIVSNCSCYSAINMNHIIEEFIFYYIILEFLKLLNGLWALGHTFY